MPATAQAVSRQGYSVLKSCAGANAVVAMRSEVATYGTAVTVVLLETTATETVSAAGRHASQAGYRQLWSLIRNLELALAAADEHVWGRGCVWLQRTGR